MHDTAYFHQLSISLWPGRRLIFHASFIDFTLPRRQNRLLMTALASGIGRAMRRARHEHEASRGNIYV